MLSVRGIYDGKRIKPIEKFDAPSNVEVIITFLPKVERDVQSQITKDHLQLQQLSLGKIWDNPEEDVYGDL